MFGAFRRVVREFRPEVVISFFAYPYGYAAAFLARTMGLPVVVGVLGSDINELPRVGLKRSMVRYALNASDKVFSVSHALKQAVRELEVAPEKIIVIPNGVDPGRFGKFERSEARETLSLPGNTRMILCVSNLVRVKGVDLVIRAFAKLRDEGISLVVVGDGVQRRELEDMVRELKLEHGVRFVGARPSAEVPVWMAASDLVVLGSRAEGHPNVIIEALASGRPVVATRVGAVSDTVTSPELGMVVEPEDPDAMACAIRAALSCEWNEQVIRRAGLHRSWDDVADQIMIELEALVAVGPRARGRIRQGSTDDKGR